MFANALKAALHNLIRNRLYAAISIFGLAIGLVAVIFTALYVIDELSFDHFVPNYKHVYVLVSEVQSPGQAPISMDYAPSQTAGWLKLEAPGIKHTARLAYGQATLRHGEIAAQESIAWVDPAFFEIMHLPTVQGELDGALEKPDEVVVTEHMAEKYFGTTGAIGQTVLVDGRPMRVHAVLQNLPDETHLNQEIFAAGGAADSPLTRMSSSSLTQGFLNMVVNTPPAEGPAVQFIRGRVYIEVDSPAQATDIEAMLADFSKRHDTEMRLPAGAKVSFQLVRLDRLHLYPFKGANLGATDSRGSGIALQALEVIAGLVLALAGINFINLTTARAARRAVEVGVRKSAGATRAQLILQFLGEAAIYVMLAAFLSLALAEILLPTLNAALLRKMELTTLGALPTASVLVLILTVFAIAAAAYPAFVISSFRPSTALRGGPIEMSGSVTFRQALIIIQFAVLTILLVAASAIWLQTRYAMAGGLKLNKDNVVVIHSTPCRGAFVDEIRKLQGVVSAACSSRAMLGLDDFSPVSSDTEARATGLPSTMLSIGLVDFGFFELYQVKPLAGRLFDRQHGGDELSLVKPGEARAGNMVINETAARKLGFSTPAQAINQSVVFSGGSASDTFRVIGVVPDFKLDLRNAAVKPTAYLIDFAGYPLDQVLSVKLKGQDVSETTSAIDEAWKASGHSGAMRWQLLDQYVHQLYASTIREGMLITSLCVIAILLACLGLFGLAAFTAERRTKEIGVRKAMGARTRDILSLMMWQFTKPVLIANAIGLPLAFVLVQQWLNGFTYRIDLNPGLFVGAFLGSMAIAWITVLSHAIGVARSKPVNALHYE